jgi:hypothetical protein
MRPRPSYANVVSSIALFLVLTGGAAYALDGSNTVFSDDIVNGEVRNGDIRDGNVTTADLRTDAVTSAKIADGEVRSAEVLNDSLTPTDIADVGFLRTNTARLNDQPGGSVATQTLFTIGRVTLRAICSASNTNLVADIRAQTTEVGPVLVTDGEAGNADFVTPLQPDSVDFLVIVSAAQSAEETSFAILDDDNTTASGVAAVSVDPDTGDCVITAQAVG